MNIMKHFKTFLSVMSCMLALASYAQSPTEDVVCLEKDGLFYYFAVTITPEKNLSKAQDIAVEKVLRTIMTKGVVNFNDGVPLVDAEKRYSSSIESFFKNRAYSGCARSTTNVFTEGEHPSAHYVVKVKCKALGGLVSTLKNPPYRLMTGELAE